ncbi:hypothetical protein RMATCC62417_13208 [Rhizopus microsporus]|nr:hypothetical protein RMATCC62417_13208 [Rhizopus microsporus]
MHRSEMNKQYFMKDVGYRTVENAIILTGALIQRHIAERVFGILLSFVIESEAVLDIFTSVTNGQDNTSGSAENDMYMEKIESMLSQSTVVLANPEIIPTILHLQKAALAHKQLCRAVLSALFALSQASRGNQVKLNRSGLLLTLLQRVFPDNETEDVEEDQDREIMLSLMKNLMNMGISSNELRYIFKRFDLNTENNQSSDVLDLILHGASGSRWPGFIQFNDPTTYLEIPQLANFPPPNPGYTLLFWLHIEKQNDVSSLPLFNVWSDQQQIFRVFIDARSKMLLVQSSYSKQPVLFKSFEFHVGFWYHLALVHNKSRLSPRLSSISMYVNGIFIEKVACSYIPQPSVSFPLRATIGYAPGNSLKKQHLIWNLGPTYLIQDTLEKETINLYFSLGPRYRSLYQDSLRQFQTYEATTSLYLTIRNMSKGRRSDSSDQQLLTSILDGSAFQMVPENKIVFAFSAYNTLSEGAYSGLTLTGMSLATRQTIIAENNNSRMIINAAVPKLDIAVYRPNSMGYLIGELIVAYPLGLDESICKIGGCAVALKLIECSQTAQNLCKATAFLFETIRYSWRNSADMERCHGYEILAYILKQKRDIITLELLELLLVFIGKNAQQPENSIINNPLVYRYVVLNFEIWKKTSLEVQKAQLDQFNLFLSTSNFRAFNVKRLQKIHLVKKLLLAFRMNIYSKELVPYVVKALKAVMLSNWDTEGIRAIATFLASTVSQGSMNTTKSNRLRSDSTHSTSSSATIDEDIPATTDILLDARQAGRFKKSAQMCNIVLEMLHDILCDKSIDPEYINRFASTITNRWPLLFFAPNTNPFTALLAIRVLARLFISQGPSYVGKFKSASDGFLILRKLLPAYWNAAQIHETLILLMMGMDIADYPLQPFSGINGLRRCLQSDRDSKMIIPDVLPIVLNMWDEARKAVGLPKITTFPPMLGRPGRKRSDSIATQTMKSNDGKDMTKSTIKQTMDEFVLLVDELYDKRPLFKEVCNKQETQDFFVQVLFLNVCQTNSMLAEDELNSKDAVLANAEIDPATPSSAVSSPVDGSSYFGRSSGADDTASIDSATMSPGRMIKRGGTSALTTKTSPHVSRRTQTFTLRLKSASWSQNSFFQNTRPLQEPVSDPLLDFVVKVCVQSIFNPQDKSQTGLSLVMNAFPPSTHEQQLYFESYLMTHIAQNVKSGLQLDEELLLDQRILNNVAKFGQIAADAAIQGRFRVGGIEQTYDLLASILEILHSDSLYSRCSANDTSIVTIYRSFNRMILAKISDLEYGDNPMKVAAFLDYCIHHQKIILSAKNTDGEFLRCFCYHLYYYLQSANGQVKDAAANIWKLLLLQKPEDISLLFAVRIKGFECDDLNDGFRQMLEMDLNSFYTWLDSRKVELNVLFNEYVCKSWEQFIVQELKNSREMLKSYVARRINKLRRIQRRESHEREVLSEYTKKSTTWSQEIQEVETNRFMKALQDFEGHENFIHNEWIRISEDLTRERAIWGPEKAMNITWRLDNTEGPNRMRKRLQCVSNVTHQPYLPKLASRSKLSPLSTSVGSSLKKKTVTESKTSPKDNAQQAEKTSADSDHSLIDDELSDSHEDNDEQLFYEEDKSRKVLRLLDQGDMVLDVYNVSQIAGVDACEGLLLLCNNNIYLIDNFFQRSDGEVVEIWDVPKEERDQYLLLIARAAGMETEQLENTTGEHTCRKWSAADLRDVFKRRFLFRDVALEMFFKDGQNALITVALSERDELYSKLVARIESHEESANTIFQGEIENTSSLSSTFRLSSLFGTSTLNDLVQRWERREISNFQYLMYLNAIAGRSYNDITQYPVFPWILADYKSDELDLSNPKTFRDLTKPMGAQTEERRREFEDRYRQWGETGDPTPAFHYGTHYSSAMIVCSFLIRLEPFTQHYLKLQGGTFDHADRLFDSIGKAWDSASEKNMGDVRELIPEFFYLPDFLVNVNKFNFGVKQGSGEAIDSVVLPPWAHGDPKIFIQKHREALESDYVSANLHHWIDLIFGYKQQGKAAIETLNVFHHVSYEGAVGNVTTSVF